MSEHLFTEMDLNRLIEECAEVIQAATKIKRFGVKGSYGDGTPNMKQLTTECGQVLACMDRLHLLESELDTARYNKHRKIRALEKYELGFNCELTPEEREALHFGTTS